ncbi:MAG: YaeQ family protein [Myxococcota bacterium]
MTVHTIDLAVSDVDRGVYESVALRVARHPSESAEYLVARVLAFALEWREGIAFTQGLSAAEEPAIEVRDLTGQRTGWIEIGTPGPERLHRARKAVEHVSVYCHKDPAAWLRSLAGAKLHMPESIGLWALDRRLIGSLTGTLDRRASWSVSRTEGELFLDVGGASFTGALERLSLSPG